MSYRKIQGLLGGRFSVSVDGDIIDNIRGSHYPPAQDTLQNLFAHDVPDMNEGDGTYIPLVRLWALAVTPLPYIGDSDLLREDFPFIPYWFDYNSMLTGREVNWYTKEPVYHGFHSDHAHIPFATQYVINAEGKIINLAAPSGENVLVLGTGETHHTIINNHGQSMEITPLGAIIYAFGLMQDEEIPIYFVDGDETNIQLSNLKVGANTVVGKVVNKPTP